jgi:hypothetical protein
VRQVQGVHDADHEREAGGEDEQQHAVRDAVEHRHHVGGL